MARVRTRLPDVFVGHPFASRFAVKKFRAIFRILPFNVIYGNTDLQTRHLLTIMKSNITKSDFSIFDLSDWNPNVALELGLSEGLKKKAGKDYYILLNTRRSGDVPSDIRGLQRLWSTPPTISSGRLGSATSLSITYWRRNTGSKNSGRRYPKRKRARRSESRLFAFLRIFESTRNSLQITSHQ